MNKLGDIGNRGNRGIKEIGEIYVIPLYPYTFIPLNHINTYSSDFDIKLLTDYIQTT